MSLANTLRYRIHVKEAHAGEEPKENFDPENFSRVEDFVCRICDIKFKEGKHLKHHIIQSHLEVQEEEKERVEEGDPLGDPLAGVETDLDTTRQDEEGEDNTNCDNIEMKDIEVIKANGEINTMRQIPESNTPKVIPIKPNVPKMSADEKVQTSFLFCLLSNVLFRSSWSRKCSTNSEDSPAPSAQPGCSCNLSLSHN